MDNIKTLTPKHTAVLCLSILIVALCGIAYELIIAAVSSYLLGNSVYQFSITIGLFMFAMGVGSYISRFFNKDLVRTFVIIEIIIALVGGVCSMTLFIVFAHTPSLYQLAMYSTIIIIGSLVGIEIPLLTRILATQKSIKDALAEVFSLDYLGALIGSLVFPLLLLPHLGLVRSSFAVGILNIAVAILNVWVFRAYWKKPARVLWCSAILCVGLVAAIVAGTRLTRFVEQKLYFDEIVFRHQSAYQRVILTKSSLNQQHRLYIDGHIQFAEQDEHRYHEALVHPCMSQNAPAKRILILGGGDGMGVREVFKWEGVEKVDMIDIDPAITKVCSEVEAIAKLNERAFDDPRLTVYHMDAFTFVRDNVKEPYDRIIIDLPDPHNEVLNKLYSREFYGILKKAVREDGAIVSQCSSPFMTRKVYWCIAHSMEAAGLTVKSYQTQVPSFGVWGFHMCFPNKDKIDLSRPFPDRLKYLTPEVMSSLFVFGKDISRIDVPVNSMLEPSLYMIYNEETKQ